MTAAVNATTSRFAPARPGWRRLTLLVSLLLAGWALLLPTGAAVQWWHYAAAGALILAFVGSWHSQHISTVTGRWVPMALHNRRQRTQRTKRTPIHRSDRNPNSSAPPATQGPLEARIVVHLRSHPHQLTTAAADETDQLPWEFITAWLHRYGVRADALDVCSMTRTPPTSGLRADSGSLVGGRNTQHHDTWLTYTFRADNNVGALTARGTTMGTPADSATGDEPLQPHRTGLADTTARRLIAELRERGWLATLGTDAGQVPQFVPDSATVRRETWTGTEFSDGFRAVYAVEPDALRDVLQALPALNTKATWVVVTVRPHGSQPMTVEAAVGTVTASRPPRHPLPGLHGFHGNHRRLIPALSTSSSGVPARDVAAAPISVADLAALRWPTSAMGIPIGFNRQRQPVYLGLASPEPVRITVTGTRAFHVGVIARLALSGLPIALYTAEPRQWAALASHAAPEQLQMRPPAPDPEAIVVSDGSSEVPAGAITVTLRRPQSAQAPATTIVITQDVNNPDLFYINTAHERQWLSTRSTVNRS